MNIQAEVSEGRGFAPVVRNTRRADRRGGLTAPSVSEERGGFVHLDLPPTEGRQLQLCSWVSDDEAVLWVRVLIGRNCVCSAAHPVKSWRLDIREADYHMGVPGLSLKLSAHEAESIKAAFAPLGLWARDRLRPPVAKAKGPRARTLARRIARPAGAS